MLSGLADALDALRAQGSPVNRVLLIGGAAKSRAVRAVAPALFDAPVSVPNPGEYVAIGAARQAAWALSGAAEPPQWPVAAQEVTAAGARALHRHPPTGATTAHVAVGARQVVTRRRCVPPRDPG